MPVLIRAVHLEGFSLSGGNIGDQWLESYDLEAHNGWGQAEWTDDKAKALQFADIGAAFAAWKSSPRSRPTRPDGEPNRPLTAFTITFDHL